MKYRFSNRNCHRCWVGILLIITLILSTGCSRSDCLSIQGHVTLDGKPLTEGYINFRPQSGSLSPTAGGIIVEGRFFIERARGPMPGRFRVEITAARPSGRSEYDDDGNKLFDCVEQYLPAKYNSQSELEIEVTTDGENIFEFNLESEPQQS